MYIFLHFSYSLYDFKKIQKFCTISFLIILLIKMDDVA